MKYSDLTNEDSIEETNNELAQIIQKLNKIEKSLPDIIEAPGYDEARSLVLEMLNEIPSPIVHYYAFWYKSTEKLLKKYKAIHTKLKLRIESGLNEDK